MFSEPSELAPKTGITHFKTEMSRMFRTLKPLGYSPRERTIPAHYSQLFTVIHLFPAVIPVQDLPVNPYDRDKRDTNGAKKVEKRRKVINSGYSTSRLERKNGQKPALKPA